MTGDDRRDGPPIGFEFVTSGESSVERGDSEER